MAEEKPTKPKVTLEDIFKVAGTYQASSQIAERQTYADDLRGFHSYLNAKGIKPEDVPGIDSLGQDPARFSEMMATTAALERKDLATKTESALKDVVVKFDEKTLSKLAFQIGNSDKTYAIYSAALQNQDAGAIAQAYADKHKDNPYLMAYAQLANAKHFMEYAQIQLGRMEESFVKKNLYTEETTMKDGKPVKAIKYDSTKAQKYLIDTVSGFKEAKKEEALIQLGMTAAQIFAQEKAKKEKEAKEKAAKK